MHYHGSHASPVTGRLTGASRARRPGRPPGRLSCRSGPWYPCGAALRPLALRVGLGGRADAGLHEASRRCPPPGHPRWHLAARPSRTARITAEKALEFSGTRLMHLCCCSSARAGRGADVAWRARCPKLRDFVRALLVTRLGEAGPPK